MKSKVRTVKVRHAWNREKTDGFHLKKRLQQGVTWDDTVSPVI
jgi:hypothetical protein